MSTDTLIGCWKAIDADSTGRGLIDTGEFGRFMKKGKPEKGPSWQERNMEASKAARHAVDADKDDRFNRDVARRLESVAVATDEEVVAASKVLNDAMGAALRDIDPAARSFIKLFNKMVRKPLQPLTSRYHPVTTPYHPLPPLTTPYHPLPSITTPCHPSQDNDGSGKAAYVEFESLLRVNMHVSKQELPTRQVTNPNPYSNPDPDPSSSPSPAPAPALALALALALAPSFNPNPNTASTCRVRVRVEARG